jgi:hypothetical protein
VLWSASLKDLFHCIEAASNVVALPLPSARAVIADAAHPRRGALEAFVAQRFASAYKATIHSHYPLIAGLIGRDGQVLAAAGLRSAGHEILFLESYTDGPIEVELGRAFGRSVLRSAIVEIGGFASCAPAWSLQLFELLSKQLASAPEPRFAVATLRPELARTLGRSGFNLEPIMAADPARLGAAALEWGSYYTGGPKVYAGRIGGGVSLSLMQDRLHERLQARTVQREFRRGRALA